MGSRIIGYASQGVVLLQQLLGSRTEGKSGVRLRCNQRPQGEPLGGPEGLRPRKVTQAPSVLRLGGVFTTPASGAAR
jgi:hypothetical protein